MSEHRLNTVILTEGGAIPLSAEVVIVDALKVVALTLAAPVSDMAGRTLKIINRTPFSFALWHEPGFDRNGFMAQVATFAPGGILSLYVDVHAQGWQVVPPDGAQGVTFA